MKLGCAAYSYRQDLKSGALTLHGFVDLCADMGLDGVELTSYYFADTDRQSLNDLKRHCFRRGLDILATAVGSNFTQADPEKRYEHIRMTREWIDHSVVLGAPCIRVFAGPVPEDGDEATAVEWAVECLRECVDHASRQGVVVALENHGGITSRAEQVLAIARQVESPWFGINLDFGNFKEDPYEEFRQVAPLAVTTHAKVNLRAPDGPRPVDYARVRDVMREQDYRGFISIEYEEEEPAMTGVPRFARYLRETIST